MLRLVQDVHTGPGAGRYTCADTYHPTSFDIFPRSPPDVDGFNNAVTLATSASAHLVQPVAILGLTYTFGKWVSTTVLQNMYAPLPIFPF